MGYEVPQIKEAEKPGSRFDGEKVTPLMATGNAFKMPETPPTPGRGPASTGSDPVFFVWGDPVTENIWGDPVSGNTWGFTP